MSTEIENVQIKALPIQLIEIDGGVIVKRSCTEFKVAGSGVKEVLNWLVEVASRPEGVGRVELINAFSGADRDIIANLVAQLEARQLFVPVDSKLVTQKQDVEIKEDVFFWNFGQTKQTVAKSLSKQKIVLLGVNYISHHLAKVLGDAGCEKLKVIDVPNLRNLDFFEGESLSDSRWQATAKPSEFDLAGIAKLKMDCVIAASDFGGVHAMRDWNKQCVELNVPFLPIVLQNLVGYVGPFVMPGETPCYECLRARQNANLDDVDAERAAEAAAFDSQQIAGFHPSMATILADIAHLEISKFFAGWSNSEAIGKLIQVHMLTPSITTSKVLKVPRCSVCSPLKKTSSIVVQKDFYMPGNEE